MLQTIFSVQVQLPVLICIYCVIVKIVIWLVPWVGKMNEILRCDWLPERARWGYLAAFVSQEKFPRKPYNKSFIDQACSVKMAGYWPRSFFTCLWTSTPSRSINTQNIKLADIQPSRPQTWSITHIYTNSTSLNTARYRTLPLSIASR